jgi:large-conductance mechanosensitive channel
MLGRIVTNFQAFLSDTTAAANIPGVAKEGIISLLISIVANEATSTVSGLTYENLLRTLVMFLVILAIIHYSLKILEQLRRKSANLGDLQGANTRKALNDLNHSHTILDRFIQDSTEVTELRNLRNRLTTLISDIQNPNLSKFGQRPATVDEFNAAEKSLVESSEKLSKELERQSKESLDVKLIARFLDSADEAIRNRIPLSNELKDLYV